MGVATKSTLPKKWEGAEGGRGAPRGPRGAEGAEWAEESEGGPRKPRGGPWPRLFLHSIDGDHEFHENHHSVTSYFMKIDPQTML